MRSKYKAGFNKNGVFFSCIESNSPYAISDIAEERNYELREKIPDLKVGKLILKNRFKILRHETTQLRLSTN